MLHYTCDQCGRVISGQRFSVNIEIRRTTDEPQLTAADLDQDNLQEIADEISLMDSTSEFQLPEPVAKTVKLGCGFPVLMWTIDCSSVIVNPRWRSNSLS